jgi:hypothetical protein
MRVRISFDALRLCLLVAAGVTSGYLWRAAFESSSPAEERVAANPRIVEKAPAPPVVRIAPHHLTRHPPAVSPRVVQHLVVRPTRTAATGLIASHVATPPSSAPQPEPSQPPPPPAKPTPAPAPAPAPPPTTTTSPPPQTPPPPVVAAPVQQAAAPPAAPTTTTTPEASGDGSRPGWGKGDDNHDHTGPGGGGKGK